MFTSLDTTIALGCILCVWTFSPCSQAQDLPRTKRQNSLYFREPAGRSSRVRFQDDSPISWSSPSDRIQSRSSEDHDPGPSRQARFTDSPWQAGGSSSSLRFQEDGGSSEGRSSGSSFKFQDDLGSSEGRSSFKFDDDKSVSFGSTPSSPFRFGSGGVEGRSNSDEHFGFPSAESNEFYGRNSDFSKDSGEDFPWKSSPEPSVFPGGKRNSGRQSKVSPIFESKPPSDSFEFPSSEDSDESPRHLSPDTIATISETLGAINTVGRYLVNYTRGSGGQHPHGNYRPHPTPGLYGDRLDEPPSRSNEDLPGAILTISKNVLGRNVTDSIAPLVRVLPIGSSENSASGPRPCTTPGGKHGVCEDLSNCPQLLLDLGNLRQSICFKSLFVPGVCCPKKEDSGNTFLQEIVTTTRPMILTTKFPLITAGTQASYTTTTTQRPNSIDYEFSTLGECGVQEAPKFRVVGGEEALPGRWPWMAAIFLHGPRRTEFWCGGSLIGSRHVLTAAHCTKDTRQRPFQARQFTVRLGDIDLKRDDEPSSPQTYRVADVRAHPRFNRQGFYNDIAVLVLDRPVRRSRYIIPVCLPPPTSRHNNFVGEQPTVVGWGTTYYGGKESTVQRQVALPVWKNEDCDKTYFQPINENFICAGLKEGGKDACQGDSGGPLVLKKNGRWMQIGIVSFGNKCGEPGYPGVYTRVTQYLDWITGNMN